MHPSDVRNGRLLFVALGLLVAMLAYLDAQRPAVGQTTGASPGAAQVPPTRVSEAEAVLARTDLDGRIQAALGDAFGGVWFEPSTATLHVGVISPASRRLVERVAARAGLPELVVGTVVRSTWAQLEATQEDWNRRLADLFERGLVTTSLVPERSLVQIELSASVAGPRRALLEREAAAGEDVEVVVSPRRSLFATQAAQCQKWVQFEANCDPTIVAGTTLASEKDGGGKRITTCTTGPAARLKDRSTAAKTTKTYVLTAGHCIAANGGVGKKWYAFEKNGTEKELGPAGVYLNGETDIGVVEVKSPWAKTNNAFPVAPATAFWDKTVETDPTAVSFEGNPKKNAKICAIGQRSMEVCGTIVAENLTITFEGEPEATKKLFKVELEKDGLGNQTRAGSGDSGGPIRAGGSVSTIDGVFVGFTFEEENKEMHKNKNEGKFIYFHSLATAFAELEGKKGVGLELLRKANEKRVHPVVTAAEYPVTFSAENVELADRFTAFGSSLECAETQFHGELTKGQQEAAPTVFELAPTYKNCLALGGIGATFTGNGCAFKFTVKEEEELSSSFSATAAIVCPAGKAGIQFDIGAGLCTITFPPQEGLSVPNLTNDGEEIVIEGGTVEGVQVQKSGTFCGSGETAEGVYDLNNPTHIAGTDGFEAVKVDIGGE